MAELLDLEIGAEVICTDGAAGKLERVVVDPVRKAVTHVVIALHDREELPRLVPVDTLSVEDGAIHANFTKAHLLTYDAAENVKFIDAHPSHLELVNFAPNFTGGGIMAFPYTSLASPLTGISLATHRAVAAQDAADVSHMDIANMEENREITEDVKITDRVPPNEVAVRHGDRIHATDGEIGHVHSLVIDPVDYHVTHVLLEEGHVFSHKEVVIPIGEIEHVDTDGVHVSLSKAEVEALPPVDLEHLPAY